MRYHTMKHLLEGLYVERLLGCIDDPVKAADMQSRLQRYETAGVGLWPYYDGVQMQEALRERGLLRSGLSSGSTAMQAIGYKEIVRALDGQCSMAQAVEDIKRESRRYAKRQLTWLRRDEELRWILWKDEPDISAAADSIVSAWRGQKI